MLKNNSSERYYDEKLKLMASCISNFGHLPLCLIEHFEVSIVDLEKKNKITI